MWTWQFWFGFPVLQGRHQTDIMGGVPDKFLIAWVWSVCPCLSFEKVAKQPQVANMCEQCQTAPLHKKLYVSALFV